MMRKSTRSGSSWKDWHGSMVAPCASMGNPLSTSHGSSKRRCSNLWLTRKIETLRINPAFASLRISRTGRFSDTTLQKSGWSRNCSMGEMLIMSRSRSLHASRTPELRFRNHYENPFTNLRCTDVCSCKPGFWGPSFRGNRRRATPQIKVFYVSRSGWQRFLRHPYSGLYQPEMAGLDDRQGNHDCHYQREKRDSDACFRKQIEIRGDSGAGPLPPIFEQHEEEVDGASTASQVE